MKWTMETRYQILLEITNAVITQTSKQAFFNSLCAELRKHLPFDRLSINLYDRKSHSLQYFAEANGVEPKGISSLSKRSLTKGTIAKMVIQSRKPIIIDDLSRFQDQFSINQMIRAGLVSTMAFPLIMRNMVFGSLHFSFKKTPDNISELSQLLAEISKQVSQAVDNLISYNYLQDEKQNLESKKQYLIGSLDDYNSSDFTYVSPQMAEIMGAVKRVAGVDAPVFITGETGTGKDFLARYIHYSSSRRDHLFVKVNCPAISPNLFESELFGHCQGAFTGADKTRIGRFELADKGTIFLDEVGELPESQQVKLLQVLQENHFERVGDSRPIEGNFRLISATNNDPLESIQNKKLRKDLYYRLNILQIHVPPLRERTGDVPLLIDKITDKESRLMHQEPPRYTRQAMALLNAYHWPGNIRELKNIVKRMIILKPDKDVSSSDIEKIIAVQPQPSAAPRPQVSTLADSEREAIEQALIQCNGVLSGKNGAARLLDVPRSTLQYRMKKYNITPQVTLNISGA